MTKVEISPKTPAKKRVLAFGTFDIIHPGHIDFLRNAKALGDELFLIISRDSTVLKRKGVPARFPEELRRQNVAGLGIADMVILGEKEDYLKIPRRIAPDIIALGYDQAAPLKLLREAFPQAKIARLSAHFPEEFKSSKLRDIFPES